MLYLYFNKWCLRTKALRAGPLNNFGRRFLVLEGRVIGSEGLTVDLDTSEMAVSLDRGCKGSNKSSDMDLGRQFGMVI